MAEPLIFTNNFIDENNIYSSSHYNVTQKHFYDKSRSTQMISVGGNLDTISVDFTVQFRNGTLVALNRNVEAVWILNHNFKEWVFEYWNGSAWTALVNQTNDLTSDRFINMGGTATGQIRFRCTKTKVADATKKFGELIVVGSKVDIGSEMTTYDVRYREKVKDIILGDGTLHRVVTRHGSNGYGTQKYEATATFKYMTAAQRDLLRAVKEAAQSFFWQPESTSRPEEIYEVIWTSPWAEKYSAPFKSAGYDITMQLRAV